MDAPDPLAAVESLRARLWDAGFRPVALYNHDSTKTASPGKAPKGLKWVTRARRDPPEAAIGRPDPEAMNTGILADGLRIVDIDVDDADLAGRLRAMALAMLGNDALIRTRPGTGRSALVYRAAEGMPPKRVTVGPACKVEVLGRGQQLHAFGPHPSGAEPQWHPEPPGAALFQSLPAVAEDQIAAFLASAAPLIGAASSADTASNAPSMAPHTPSAHGPTADPLDVVGALAVILNDGPANWEYWNKIGMAVYAATGGSLSGFAAFCAWSEQHPDHDPDATRDRWDHYRRSPPTQIGAGTLFQLARDARPDWRKPTTRVREIQTEGKPAQSGETGGHSSTVAPRRLLTARELFDLQAPEFLIDDLLPARGVGLIGGASGAFKTFLTTALAGHIAAGKPIGPHPVKQGRVVYLANEGQAGLGLRMLTWETANDAADVPVLFARQTPDLTNESSADEWIETIRAEAGPNPITLIIIDTFGKATLGADEDRKKDMAPCVANMQAIADAYDCFVLAVHHLGKDPKRGLRGSVVLRTDTDAVWLVERISKTELSVNINKLKDAPDGFDVAFSLKTREVVTPDGEVHADCPYLEFNDAGLSNEAMILAILTRNDGAMLARDLQLAFCAEGKKANVFRTTKSRMLASGALTKEDSPDGEIISSERQ
jgi:hypothetical protein